MIHDLDAINSAIRLGDKVLPPKGCVISWINHIDNRKYKGTVNNYFIFGIGCTVFCHTNHNNYVRVWLSVSNGVSCRCYPDMDRDLEILSIPEDVPPFEKWKRWER